MRAFSSNHRELTKLLIERGTDVAVSNTVSLISTMPRLYILLPHQT